jgi:hypothetical protein
MRFLDILSEHLLTTKWKTFAVMKSKAASSNILKFHCIAKCACSVSNVAVMKQYTASNVQKLVRDGERIGSWR